MAVEGVESRIVLTLECADQLGIVHAVTGFLAEHGCNITDSQQFNDARAERFYLRIEATHPATVTVDQLRTGFDSLAGQLGMTWRLDDAAEPTRTIVMVSKTTHCLNELLEQWHDGQLNIDIVAIVGNHDDLRPIAEQQGIPFHLIPVTPETKPAAEATLLGLIDELDAELIVMARYMQILSDDLCARLPQRVINIHHSFLPGFKGARPYHQAWDRGVKFVGASAHYATADLDEGPIIEQEVFRVDHRATPEDLVVAGRQAERAALARAVAWHAERRIIVTGRRTVVFS
ncbi:formyltetrahydrofolate deformylase [Microbacterium sp. PI-1]|uniref:formyltetrahydrofolate deformylase n=1 Tax=Microbacterium sp. PI-1 TaxID=2545631 RepID=UPI0010393183|nr:formyltetrahydrofolate deformylase [Microbacterium sp. PI-1]TCJ21556.1 formyltetrahydrofolate deformylase [Microbacterium sp. PI-1]